jgi:hypothetical protein
VWALVDAVSRHRSSALRRVERPPALDRVPVAATTEEIGGAVDVMIDLAGLGTAPPARTRHGVWRFEFGPDGAETGGGAGATGLVGLGDIVEGRPTADLRLLAHTADGRTIVLRRGTIRTIAESWTRHRDGLLLHGVDWPVLACRDVLAGRAAGPACGQQPAVEPRRTGRASLARLTWRLVAAHARRLTRFLREPQWHVGVVAAPIDAFLRPGELPPPRWLPGPPRGAFYADPFASADGRRVIVERFGLRERVGTLQALDATPGPSPVPPQPVAAPGHHISYPYVVVHEGRAYCTPETAELDEVGLYRFVGEPVRIEKVRTLVAGIAAVDPTVTCHGGRWWLFFTDGDRDADADLHVWHAGDLIGPWRPHARNPVKVDVRSSRPAGTPFTCGGRLFRPAMDNSRAYGERIVINQVVELTPDDFAERVAAVVPPFPGLFARGIHTLAAAGQSTIVDGKRLRIVPSALPARIRAHRDGRPSG